MEIKNFYKTFKKVVKSTDFELEQSFKHIFGVVENFWFNGGVKREGPSHCACYTLKFLKLDKIHHFYEKSNLSHGGTSI